ncbi:DUF1127 domain-containing protein [Pseudomonas sp. PS1]|uniref:DUF1127 domain-containing protein n=1 Tax=Stutzerimonas marianensis TaxID=2929513 RepID=A0A9X1W7Q2_9GAMM|nr:DUF1127 domain-containing protein [Pseudomonas marianensis]MCJ0975194.1 DUF1127 domain-containing protein [Pseudomonas marianensis]
MERVLVHKASTAIGLPSFAHLARLFHLWRYRARSRRQLAALDERLLADVGISHSERQEELSKPFWR